MSALHSRQKCIKALTNLHRKRKAVTLIKTIRVQIHHMSMAVMLAILYLESISRSTITRDDGPDLIMPIRLPELGGTVLLEVAIGYNLLVVALELLERNIIDSVNNVVWSTLNFPIKAMVVFHTKDSMHKIVTFIVVWNSQGSRFIVFFVGVDLILVPFTVQPFEKRNTDH